MSPNLGVPLDYVEHGFKRFCEIEIGWSLGGFLPQRPANPDIADALRAPAHSPTSGALFSVSA